MSLKNKAYRLYEYISQVYSIDLPVNRDVTNYRAELWWQADLIPCEQFKIKEFCSGNNNIESENETETSEGDAWLSMIKRSYEGPPEPPYILSVLFRAKKVIVVGDPEQISPSNVGIERDKVFELINQYLSDIPYPLTFTIDNSLYEITKAIPRMNRTLLTEHFRCVPQIIEFNNRLCPTYEGRLEPLRQPNPQERLEPVINAVFVENGFKNDNDINEPEAEALVEMLVKCCKDERYKSGGKNNRKRTMGVISLLGEKQAKHTSALIAKHLDETEREERRVICGDAYAFQGDERDVMFLSIPFRAILTIE